MLARAVYRLATAIALPLAFVYFHWRGRREPGYRAHWGERLGRGAPLAGRPIWVHAASVGEVVLIAPLVEALRAQWPDRAVLLTTVTPTGRERARARFGDTVRVRYLPLDTVGATRRFMRGVRPAVGVVAETELWPHLIAAAERADVPMMIVNASVSTRSATRYRSPPIAGLVGATLRRLAGIGAISEAHAQRFRALGARREAVTVTGNLKFDVPDLSMRLAEGPALRRRWQAEGRPILVAASTHEGEEAIVLEAFERLRRRHPQALLVLAPRHPQRFDGVAELLAARSWRYVRRSGGAAVAADTDVVLADTLGEVPDFYAAADAAFVGGSLVAGIGGHNVLEPAALGRPICVGPHIEDWRDIVDALAETGALQVVSGPEALAAVLADWFDAPDAGRDAGAAGARLVAAQGGALADTAAFIRERVGQDDDI